MVITTHEIRDVGTAKLPVLQVARTLPPEAREALRTAAAVPGERARAKAIDEATARIRQKFPKLFK
jgi:hypothetical protein